MTEPIRFNLRRVGASQSESIWYRRRRHNTTCDDCLSEHCVAAMQQLAQIWFFSIYASRHRTIHTLTHRSVQSTTRWIWFFEPCWTGLNILYLWKTTFVVRFCCR